jgi:hypothetical protein
VATNKKITELTELTGADLANDDVLPIVDISAGTTHKIQKSTLAAAVAGVAEIAATAPLEVDTATGDVTISTAMLPSSLTDGGVLLGSGAGAITPMAVLADSEMIVGDGSTDPVAESGATLRTSIGVGTGDSPQFTAVNVGAASDTTVARASAGDINVEGNIVYRAGGTDVPVADGGTGRSTLTANYALLGNGATAVQMIAPGTSGNLLTSNGSTWASTTPAAAGPVSSYTNSTDNRVITSVNSSTINGEANLTFDGSVLAVAGNVTATGTVEPAGDTSASDNAAIGYTSAEGIIITGQGSTSDVTIKNDADADVFTVPTGTTAPIISGQQMPSAGGLWSGRNMVINGAMNISQRSTSVASITSTGYYALDRWQVAIVNGGTWTMSQDTDVPAAQGFLNSLKMDCTTADASFGAADYLYVRTKLESQDCMRIRKGTANAEQVTVSFWTKSAKTGVHIVELLDNDNTRFVSGSYTISSADTWENHSVTFPADTTGAFADDNGAGLGIHFYMGAGSNYTSGSLGTTWGTTQANRAVGQVNVADNTANNWYLTGVQLEVGTAITPFEHESYGETLQKCQRYYEKSYDQGVAVPTNSQTNGSVIMFAGTETMAGSASIRYSGGRFAVAKRASPSVAIYSYTSSTSGAISSAATTDLAASSGVAIFIGTGGYNMQTNATGTLTPANGGFMWHFAADAEL